MDKAKRMVIVPERITLDRLTLFKQIKISITLNNLQQQKK
jgi:hypothetical protein